MATVHSRVCSRFGDRTLVAHNFWHRGRWKPQLPSRFFLEHEVGLGCAIDFFWVEHEQLFFDELALRKLPGRGCVGSYLRFATSVPNAPSNFARRKLITARCSAGLRRASPRSASDSRREATPVARSRSMSRRFKKRRTDRWSRSISTRVMLRQDVKRHHPVFSGIFWTIGGRPCPYHGESSRPTIFKQ
jgi:hypothetical protein